MSADSEGDRVLCSRCEQEYVHADESDLDPPVCLTCRHELAGAPPAETLDEPVPLNKIIQRLNRVFTDELHDPREDVDFHLYLDADDPGDGITRWRVRVGYTSLEDGSGVSDLGPAFTDERELRAFLRGLELGGDGSIAAKAAVT